MTDITILDGPVGTLLGARGVPIPAPLWSAWALLHDPEEVARAHRDYVAAGARVHTTNTFRTRRRTLPDDWERRTAQAVDLVRGTLRPGMLAAGSIAPLEDCYRPDLSPSDPRPEHRELAVLLADLGADLLLCETFPHLGEAWVAVEEAVATGLPTWASFTAGPSADLLTPAEVRHGAIGAIERGAKAVLVNCVPASRTLDFLEVLAPLGIPFGAYANAGHQDEELGWHADPGDSAERYADLAEAWLDLGATLIGSCCGTGPAHTAELVRRFG